MEGRVGGRDEVTVEKNEREVDEGYPKRSEFYQKGEGRDRRRE